jgi:hypothetical protein
VLRANIEVTGGTGGHVEGQRMDARVSRRGAVKRIALILTLLGTLSAIVLADTLSDAAVRQQMIAESIAAYPGRCPCPYDLPSNGSHCGKWSA